MKTLAIAVLVVLSLTSCTDADGAKKALEDAGYTDVVTGGYDVWGCGEDDTYATKFTATGPTGRHVRGVVCAGAWGKGSTIRLH